MKLKLLFFLSLLLSGCTREVYEPVGPWYPPSPLFFLIKQNNASLPDKTLNSLQLSYFENNTKHYVTDFHRATNGLDTLGVMYIWNLEALSGEKQLKDYYLEYPDGDVDTLFIDYLNLSDKEAKANSCGCKHPFQEIKFNGKTAVPDTIIKDVQVYLFEKK